MTNYMTTYFTKQTLKIALDKIQADFFKKHPNSKQKERNIWRTARHLVNSLAEDGYNEKYLSGRLKKAEQEILRCYDFLTA